MSGHRGGAAVPTDGGWATEERTPAAYRQPDAIAAKPLADRTPEG